MSEIQEEDIKPDVIIETDDGEIGTVESYSNGVGTALFAGTSALFHFAEIYRIYPTWDAVPTQAPITEFIEIDL